MKRRRKKQQSISIFTILGVWLDRVFRPSLLSYFHAPVVNRVHEMNYVINGWEYTPGKRLPITDQPWKTIERPMVEFGQWMRVDGRLVELGERKSRDLLVKRMTDSAVECDDELQRWHGGLVPQTAQIVMHIPDSPLWPVTIGWKCHGYGQKRPIIHPDQHWLIPDKPVPSVTHGIGGRMAGMQVT